MGAPLVFQLIIYSVWSTDVDHDDPHYYRVETSLFLTELDDTQPNANHIHSVWCDFAPDRRAGANRGSRTRSTPDP